MAELQAFAPWWKTAFLTVCGVVKSALTAPDGESWAPGRIFAFATFVIAQCLVVRAAQVMLPKLASAEAWTTFFIGVAGFQGATGATCIALVLGIAPVDGGGKWWGRDALPPGAGRGRSGPQA